MPTVVRRTLVALGAGTAVLLAAAPAPASPLPAAPVTRLAAVTLSAPVGIPSTGLRLVFTATPSGVPATTRTVALQARLGSAAWATVSTATWRGSGSVALSHTPTRAGSWSYRAVVLASGSRGAVNGATRVVSVRATTDAVTASATNGAWDRPLTLSATPTANPTRAASGRVVRFEVKAPGGSWATAGSVATLSNGVAVALRYTPRTSGVWQVRAVLTAAPGMPSAVSSTSTFTVLPSPTAPTALGSTISADAFGMGATAGNVPPKQVFGAVRLWDSGVSWLEVEAGGFHAADQPAVYDWSKLDALVAAANANNQSIIYSFGMTPRRYAADDTQFSPLDPNQYWPGMAQPPTIDVHGNPDPSMSAYRDFARALVRRYSGDPNNNHGVITDFQVWNEANLGGFWQGTAQQLATMTRILHEEVVAANTDFGAQGRVVAPSFGLRKAAGYYPFISDYLAAVKADPTYGWNSLDVFSAHFYPVYRGTPADMAKQIGLFQRVLRDSGAPSKPLWNTEINYLSNKSNYDVPVTPSDTDVRTIVGQTMIRSLSAGVARTYWYGWMSAKPYLGLTFWNDGGRLSGLSLPAEATARIRSWFGYNGGATSLSGCTTSSAGLTSCKLNYHDGTHRWLVWSEKPNTATDTPFDAVAVPINGLGVVKYATTMANVAAPKVAGVFQATAEPVLVTSSL